MFAGQDDAGRKRRGPAAAIAAALMLLVAGPVAPSGARAFCGFYVSGADASLYANATMVVLMRDGRRTVLSMQNDYEGPPERFAMVVPVPEVIQEDNVKTLPKEIFERLDQLAAPRLVEYWEQDPCHQPPRPRLMRRSMAAQGAGGAVPEAAPADLGVTVEAEFAVGEYDVVILSARDSSGLDTWLRQEDYNIPDGAEPILRPYVEQGTKFFVAKVDPERVTFVNGKAVLSPLRVHYDAPELFLPVRLGLLNSKGTQDLIVHVLARGTRYRVANHPNATIPTNRVVPEATKERFGSYYEELFQQVVAETPGAVVTEYSWDASSCDPCPTPPLSPSEIETLGGDVVGATADAPQPGPRRIMPGTRGFTLTRMHYRYTPDTLGEDLVFETAPAIVGGRGTPDAEGRFQEQTARSGSVNNFQGRYAVLHRWEGEIDCENPVRGRWGGPPGSGGGPVGPTPRVMPVMSPLRAASAGVPAAGGGAGGGSGAAAGDGSETAGTDVPDDREGPGTETGDDEGAAPASGGCASCAVEGPGAATGGVWPLLAAAGLWWSRRRRGRHPAGRRSD